MLWLSFPVLGQQYKLHLDGRDNKVINQWARDQPGSQDSISWIIARNELLQDLHSEGYLLAAFQKWEFIKDSLLVDIDPGSQIHWAKISFRALEYLPPHWIKQLDVSGEVVDYAKWKSDVKTVLQAAQAEGYLFADYRLEIRGLKKDSLEAEIVFNPGLKIVLDTIEVEGTAKLSDRYLEKTLGIKRGEPVRPDDLELLQEQLNNLRFVQQVSPPVLVLVQDRATVRAYLNNRNASSFDILAGLQPSTLPDQAVTLTGYVELDLVNQLTRGERIYLHLEKLRPRSQELEMAFHYPYLLDLPFGIEGEFRLLKNDTLYSELEWKAGIAMPFGRNQFIRIGITQQATNIISINKNQIISSKRLPPYIDLRVRGFTLGLDRNRLDFDLNPRKGYTIVLNGSFSQRKVEPNNVIEDLSEIDTSFDYSSLYDTITKPSSRISLTALMQYFIPWGARSTIRLALDGGVLKSDDYLFTNEMFRLGGYARLRGFDEESVLAQYYTIFTTEYRLLIGGGSYVSLFGDYAWIKNEDVEFPLEDRPFGFGVGLNLETAAGIFGMRAAVGAQRGNAINFDDARLHFGYVNRF